MSQTGNDYELIGAQASYYTAKVRAYLQYKRLPYAELGTSVTNINEKVIATTGDHTFPVVICPDGTPLKDGCDIVAALETRAPDRPVIPEDPVMHLVAALVETLADEFLSVAMIYYRWVPEDTREWALDMFSKTSAKGVRDPKMRAVAQGMANMIATNVQGRLSKVGLDRADVQAACQRVTKRTCDLLETHLATTPFMLGDRPCLADLGMMNAMWGHLYYDPCEAGHYMRRHCIHLSQWITNMHSAAGIPHRGDLYSNDTLKALLAGLSAVFASTAKAHLDRAAIAVPLMEIDKPARPGMGKAEIEFDGVEITRPTSTYTAWRLQRLTDLYQAIPVAQKAKADAFLDEAGFLDICTHQPEWRLEKRDFKLHRVH